MIYGLTVLASVAATPVVTAVLGPMTVQAVSPARAAPSAAELLRKHGHNSNDSGWRRLGDGVWAKDVPSPTGTISLTINGELELVSRSCPNSTRRERLRWQNGWDAVIIRNCLGQEIRVPFPELERQWITWFADTPDVPTASSR